MSDLPLLTIEQLTELTSEISREGQYGEHATHAGQRYQEYLLSNAALEMLGNHGPDEMAKRIVQSFSAALPNIDHAWNIEIGINRGDEPTMMMYDAPLNLRHALSREVFRVVMRGKIASGRVVPVVEFPSRTVEGTGSEATHLTQRPMDKLPGQG